MKRTLKRLTHWLRRGSLSFPRGYFGWDTWFREEYPNYCGHGHEFGLAWLTIQARHIGRLEFIFRTGPAGWQ